MRRNNAVPDAIRKENNDFRSINKDKVHRFAHGEQSVQLYAAKSDVNQEPRISSMSNPEQQPTKIQQQLTQRRHTTLSLATINLLNLLFYGTLGTVLPYLPIFYRHLGVSGM
jgi:hypothetical protein